MAKSIVVFKQNGDIMLGGHKVGVWSDNRCWTYLKSENWTAALINRILVRRETREGLRGAVESHFHNLMDAVKRLTEKEKQLNINNAK